MSRQRHKVRDLRITAEFLTARAARAAGYPKAKWIEFCEAMLAKGYTCILYEARQTFSKYITVCHGEKRFLVRFSNHAPAYNREANRDCDFFVGRTHFGVTTTAQAIEATIRHLTENYSHDHSRTDCRPER